MEHRNLGRSGLKVSSMCLGAMTFGESEGFMKGVTSTNEEARRVLDTAIDAGVNLIDTANVYSEGRSEELLGAWLEGRRDRVLIASKCRFAVGRTAGPNDKGLSRHHVIAACEASLRRLRTDRIDLYQSHMQDSSVPIEETLRAFDDLVSAGKVRYIGCSNYAGYRMVESLWAADRRNTVRYEAHQLQWSLMVRDAEREIVPACRAFGIGVLVWSPLAKGFLSGRYERGKPPAQGQRLAAWKDSFRDFDNDRGWAILEAVRAIARDHGATPSAVSLAWLLARPEVASVIIGARDVAQLQDNLAAASLSLSKEALGRLDAASAFPRGYPYEFIANADK